jgi:hypothetical protein
MSSRAFPAGGRNYSLMWPHENAALEYLLKMAGDKPTMFLEDNDFPWCVWHEAFAASQDVHVYAKRGPFKDFGYYADRWGTRFKDRIFAYGAGTSRMLDADPIPNDITMVGTETEFDIKHRISHFLKEGGHWHKDWNIITGVDTRPEDERLKPLIARTEFRRFMAGAKICVVPGGWGPSTSRIWEALWYGSFALFENDILECSHGIPLLPNKNCSSFSSSNELASKLSWYLDHEDERLEIAAAGQKLAHEYFDGVKLGEELRRKFSRVGVPL